ncbi:hypothetical protein FHS85_002920 [Rhodoligotrophos appendicifer]|uniref:DUF3168 domain-containing protein n=1 Tax=Rhodoligotrophos appendicifer TaxID=987056 RepID=UPI001185E0B3|nr:DUF3168 domain-containing protein [Rhodoligotrophos appendicifer]
MEEVLVNHLLTSSALAALVSDRVFPVVRPQAWLRPAIVITKISGLPDYTNDGPSGLASSRYQVDCWADTYAAATDVSRAVKAALSGMDVQGGDGGTPERMWRLRGGFVEGERESAESDTGGSLLFRVSLDLIIWSS